MYWRLYWIRWLLRVHRRYFDFYFTIHKNAIKLAFLRSCLLRNVFTTYCGDMSLCIQITISIKICHILMHLSIQWDSITATMQPHWSEVSNWWSVQNARDWRMTVSVNFISNWRRNKNATHFCGSGLINRCVHLM